MHIYGKILLVLGLLLISAPSHAQETTVSTVHYTTTPKLNRLLFEVSTSTKHRAFVMDKPSRLVIDITDAKLKRALAQPDPAHPLFAQVRTGVRNNDDLRVVIDLKVAIDTKHFSLTTDNSDSHRLIVDLSNHKPLSIAPEPVAKAAKPSLVAASPAQIDAPQPLPAAKHTRSNNIIVAIDAGHGGNDPGARGPNGTLEKQVTFAIAKKLATLINTQVGMRAIMVRKGDEYVSLRDRVQLARMAKANLFISIHADAFQDVNVKGASVYTLSTSGATDEAARWLADSENASDLVGVKLNDKDEDVASLLLDLSQAATLEASVNVANHVLKSFDDVAQLHKDAVQKAGFIVLKSPDMPSILVETAFISNPSEERNLLNSHYQTRMANAIFKGVRNYFKQVSPIDTKMAALKP